MYHIWAAKSQIQFIAAEFAAAHDALSGHAIELPAAVGLGLGVAVLAVWGIACLRARRAAPGKPLEDAA